MKRLLFILSGNLSTTPRAQKIINLLKDDFICEIALVSRTPAWKDKDKLLLTELSLSAISLSLCRKPFVPWLIATLKEKVSGLLYPLFNKNIDISSYASNKSSIILWDYLKKQNKSRYDLILGFGAGALYPSWKLSCKLGIPFAFDIEDYHPGELIRKDVKNERKRREFLLKRLLPFVSMIISSSPMIADKINELIGGHRNHIVTLNSFPSDEFKAPERKEGKLKLVWFSQKVTFGRGLEMLFEAVKDSFADISLTIIGEMDLLFKSTLNPEIIENVTFLPSIPQKKLHSSLAEFDVGLALELDSADENRHYCLTNKILAYAQAGLYILATDTPAQKLFIQEDSKRGIICRQSSENIAEALKILVEAKERVRANAYDRYMKAKNLSCENNSIELNKAFMDLGKAE